MSTTRPEQPEIEGIRPAEPVPLVSTQPEPAPRSWFGSLFGNLPKVVAVISTLLTMGFSGLYITCVLDLIPQCPRPGIHPVVNSIDPPEVFPGGQLVIEGDEFKGVAEAQLKSDNGKHLLLLRHDRDSRLTALVPGDIEPGDYVLEFKTKSSKSFKATNPQRSIRVRRPSRIVFSDLDWRTAKLQNSIARFIVEHGYGHRTDYISGRADDLWNSLINGTIQVNMEVWLPNQQVAWDHALIAGSFIPLGKSLDVNWQSAFVVPSYLVRVDTQTGAAPVAPGLKTIKDLRNHMELFATAWSNGKAGLWSCPPKFNCTRINRAQVKAYGLGDVIELKEEGTFESLLASLRNAYKQRKPWLGYMWGPTKIDEELELTRLVEPSCKVRQPPEEGCGYDDSRVMIVVHPGMLENAPDVVEFLRRWDFSKATQFAAEDCLEKVGGDYERAATCYLKEEEGVWTQWVPPRVRQKIRQSLKDR